MPARDVMTAHVTTVAATASLLDAARRERRVAPALGLSLQVEERLRVTHEVEGL